jgi:HEAT repeats
MKNPIRSIFLSTALLLAVVAAQPLRALSPASAPVPAADDDAYSAGTRAMNEQHWSDAVFAFDKVINAKGSRTDAALYWKAYSLKKLGNGQQALATCDQLHSQYKASPWNKDCDALSIDLRDSGDAFIVGPVPPVPPMPPVPPVPPMSADFAGPPDNPTHASEEDLKMLALNSLLNQDPSKAIPLLRSVLTGNQSTRMKKQALFVLAQSKSPEAESILHDAVTGKMDPDLQRQAIQSMAVFQGKRSNDTLAEVYRTTTDIKVKRAVISAFFITGDAQRMVDLARNEKDLDQKRYIVAQLAVMHDKVATDYMLELLK